MKYCVKCGNLMDDDMMFCSKCGAKSEIIYNNSNKLNDKLDELKQYNICIKNLSWEKCTKDKDYFGKLFGNKDYIEQDLKKLIDEILECISENNHDEVIDKLYTVLFDKCIDLMKTTKKQYDDTKELDEFKSQIIIAVKSGQMSREKGNAILQKIDDPYYILISTNFLYVGEIIDKIDKYEIFLNEVFRKKILNLISDYSKAFEALINRRAKLGMGFGFGAAKENFGQFYFKIMQGLRKTDLQLINEDGWTRLKEIYESYGWEDEAKLINPYLIDAKSELLHLADEFESKYWNEHPEKSKEKDGMIGKIDEINKQIVELQKEISMEDNKKSNHKKELEELNDKESKINKKIEELEKKIFGKKKAQEEVNNLKIDLPE
ncbi:MAG: zinc-ribbon domain-containing protein, partial [Lachnospiraceae bacterium]|nr:zinc-ribbon domain-containing protein [Lachnospiraceae bacterium]